MVVGEYLSRAPFDWDHNVMLGAFACAFHDVGKPEVRTEKHSEARGVYYSYGGHEIASARLWEDWAARNWTQLVFDFHFNADDLYAVTWMIEHHRPWGLIKHDKRAALWHTAKATVGLDVYLNLLISDNFGRIGDTQDVNRQQVLDWVEDFTKMDLLDQEVVSDDAPVLYMAIGPSGSGKSTFSKKLNNIDTFSWDDLRLEWYKADTYAEAFKVACADSEFMSKANTLFIQMVKGGKDLYVDNTNLSAKRRRFFIDVARRNGYKIVGVTFPITLAAVVSRQSTRDDKMVPYNTVRNQFMCVQQPQYGEVDQVVVCGSNL